MKKFLSAILFSAFAWAAIANPITGFGIIGSSYDAGSPCVVGGNDAFTKVLLHLDGNLTDTNAGGVSRTWTANGSAAPTATPKFGSASLNIPNPNKTGPAPNARDWIETPFSSDLTFGTGSYTVDMWVNFQGCVNPVPPSGSSANGIIGQGNAWNLSMFDCSSGDRQLVWTANGNFTTGPVLPSGSWAHVAIVRNGTSNNIYVNGTGGTPRTLAGGVTVSSSAVTLGKFNNEGSRVFIDEARISVGIARWTSNFTPPTGPYCP